MAVDVWRPQVVPDGYTGFVAESGEGNVFRSISSPGYAAGDIAVVGGTLYRWDGDSWESVPVGGGGSGDPEVFHIAGSGTPSAGPVGDSGFAYNDVGNTWVWLTNGTWGQIT